MVPAHEDSLGRQPARVFSVVDEVHPGVSIEGASHPAVEDMELRVGGWAILIRRVEE